jgi:exonuclease SbcC
MLITRIDLKNTKSYRSQTITLAEGANAICGQNGAGKTTLLEAVGFVLFDYLSNTQASFVREGEKTASITVHFVSSTDGREYQVVRSCGSRSQYFAYDPELETKIASGTADVIDWLREHLGVEPNTDLTALFRDAVGVPQGLLTAAFLLTPHERKPIFDRLIQVDEYDQVWKDLRPTVSYIEDCIASSKNHITGLEAQVVRLPGLHQQSADLRTEISDIEARLVALEAEVAQASAGREALEETRQRLEALKGQTAQLTTRLEGVSDQLVTAQDAVTQAKSAQEALEASQPGYQAYGAAREKMDELELRRGERDGWQAKLASAERSLALVQARAERLEADLAEAQDAQTRLAELRPQVERQQALESGLDTARENVRALQTAREQAEEIGNNLRAAQTKLETVEAGLDSAVQAETEVSGERKQLEETRREQLLLTSQKAATLAEMKRLEDQSNTLQASDAADCPLCEQPLTLQHRADILARNESQVEVLRAESTTLSQQAATASEREAASSRRIGELETSLRDSPRPADRDDLTHQIAELNDRLSATKTQINDLAASGGQVTTLEGELTALDSPRRRFDTSSLQANRRPEIEGQLGSERQGVTDLETTLTQIEEALVPFADLDQQLETQRAILEQHEPDYRSYLENTNTAAELAARQEAVETLAAEKQKLNQELEQTRARQEEVAAAFDPKALDAAVRQEAELKTEQANRIGKRDALQRQVAGIVAEIKTLGAAEDALAAERHRLAQHQVLLAHAQFLRDTIRQAGPYVIRRLVQQVSLRATHLFSAIMADHAARLQWTQEYGIVMEKDGRARDFEQLSGGEQMAAALAVRLALLRELSAIDIAFFDEPTSNLDDTRRDNLAEQILAVRERGFSQIFVISHDDTFERVTDHVVRVIKEDNESRVEVE